MWVSFNGRTSAFQADNVSSILITHSKLIYIGLNREAETKEQLLTTIAQQWINNRFCKTIGAHRMCGRPFTMQMLSYLYIEV